MSAAALVMLAGLCYLVTTAANDGSTPVLLTFDHEKATSNSEIESDRLTISEGGKLSTTSIDSTPASGRIKDANNANSETSANFKTTPELAKDCKPDVTFDSLDECRQWCFQEHGAEAPQMHDTRSPPNVESPNASLEPTHKVIIFNPSDYLIMENGTLAFHSLSHKIGNDSFRLNEEKQAVVCFPLNPQFVKCDKWFMDDDEVVMQGINESLKIWVIPYKHHYAVGEYFVDGNDTAICIPDSNNYLQTLSLAHWVGNLVSAATLGMALLAFLAIHNLRKKNHLIQCHIAMLFIAYTTLSVKNTIVPNSYMCIILCGLQQFFFLSSFFWMNVQAIDIFLALRDWTPEINMDHPKRFFIYALYSWGVPLTITSTTLIAELADVTGFQPHFGRYCWFPFGSSIAFLYYYAWIAAILIINFILFILIVIKFHEMSTILLAKNKHPFDQLLRVSFLLAVGLGFFWIIKVIVWSVGEIGGVLWYLDVLTAFQGFFVFIIYVTKPDFFMKHLKKSNVYMKSKDLEAVQPQFVQSKDQPSLQNDIRD